MKKITCCGLLKGRNWQSKLLLTHLGTYKGERDGMNLEPLIALVSPGVAVHILDSPVLDYTRSEMDLTVRLGKTTIFRNASY